MNAINAEIIEYPCIKRHDNQSSSKTSCRICIENRCRYSNKAKKKQLDQLIFSISGAGVNQPKIKNLSTIGFASKLKTPFDFAVDAVIGGETAKCSATSCKNIYTEFS